MDNPNHTNQPAVKMSYDPGWNDPPKSTYNAKQTTPNRPRNFLNKRVPFPLTSNESSPSSLPPMNLPPMPVAPPPPTTIAKVQTEDVIDIDSESILKEVKDTLLRYLDESPELGPKANDIRRRIKIMEELWTSGKFDSKIHIQMRDLAHALQNNEPSKADDIHRALMVDHVGAVGTWMPGVKQLIHNCISRLELMRIDQEEQ